jgi:hypothetical protein
MSAVKTFGDVDARSLEQLKRLARALEPVQQQIEP